MYFSNKKCMVCRPECAANRVLRLTGDKQNANAKVSYTIDEQFLTDNIADNRLQISYRFEVRTGLE